MKLLSEIIGPRAERTLGKLLDRDQGIKRDISGKIVSQNMPDPASRENLQRRVSKVFDNPSNREAIFRPSKMGPQGRHAAWILGQHMDTRPETQQKVADTMKNYNPSDKRTEFIKDRINVNQAARTEYRNNPQKYSSYGSSEDDAIKNMRPGREEFKGPKAPNSPQAALDLEKKKGNELLVKSIEKTGAKTQPSFATKWDDLPSVSKSKSVIDTIKSTAAEYAPKVSQTLGRVAGTVGKIAANPVVGGIMTAMEPTPANAGEDEKMRQQKYNQSSKTP